jgi:glycosyltransferase involved in cell wall biosynthesis
MTIAPCVDIFVPVFIEAVVLEASINRLHSYLGTEFPFTWRITIVDNASTDATWFRAARLARDSDRVRAMHLDHKGRGLALRTAWTASDAAVVAYMDVDLSTDLDALLPLVAPLVSGHSDVAIGSRLAAGAAVARRPKRELISRSYNAMLRAVFAMRVRDAQCGFKALRADVARRLLPAIEDDGWFFDTELLLLAERNGLRIHEVPVDWIDDADSRVRIVRTALDDLAGAARMARTFLGGGGRLDLGDTARRPLADDFGRTIVSAGLVGAVIAGVSLALFVLSQGAVGSVDAGAIADTWIAAATGRIALMRGRSRVAPIERSSRD